MNRPRLHPLQAGFTLVELMVALAVLAIIILVAAKMVGTTAVLTTVNNKHMDANDQARTVFDRMADDFTRMIKRKDVDYIFWKAGTNTGASSPANDAMYFYTEGASYFNTATFNKIVATGVPSGIPEAEKNEVSLVGYRVNNNAGGGIPSSTAADPDYYQLERLGKALSCDSGAYNSSPPANNSPQANVMAFLTYPPAGFDFGGTVPPNWTGSSVSDPTSITYSNAYFASTLAGAYSNSGNQTYGTLPSAVGSYPGSNVAAVFNDSTDTAYRTIGSQVFRFEYAFQLKDGTMSAIPVMQQSTTAVPNGVPYSLLTAGQRPLPTDDSVPPGGTNGDGSSPFAVGSRWYDTTNQIGYICLDATPNYAIWHEIGIQDISAIIVTIAVIDKQGLLYVQNSGIDLANVAAQLPDYVSGTNPANMLSSSSTYAATSWTYALTPTGTGGKSPVATATGIPQAMVSQIRVYQRCFYLNSF